MLKKLIQTAKSANTSISRISQVIKSLARIEGNLKHSQEQLEQLQQSVAHLQNQQEWLRRQTITKNIHTYLSDPEPGFENVTSQLCTLGQMAHPNYRKWCGEMGKSSFLQTALPSFLKGLEDVHHRKVWEFCYVLQALEQHNLLKPGNRGLGFAVGQEPLPAVFAKHGCQILATDLATEEAIRKGWATGK
jgi:hypothetical protein